MPLKEYNNSLFNLSRTEKNNLFIIAGFAFLVRIVYFLSVYQETWFQNPVVDSAIFNEWAIDISLGDLFGDKVYTQSPFYAYFLGFIYFLFNTSVMWAEILQFLIGIFSCVLIYLFVKNLYDESVALVAGIIATLYSITWFYEGQLLTVTLIHFLNLCFLFSLYYIYSAVEKNNWKSWIIPGLFLGLSTITRPNIILMLFVAGAWICFWFPKPLSTIRRVKAIAGLGLGVMICIIPVTVRNVVVLHELLVTVPTGGINFYIGNSARSSGFHYRQFGDLAQHATSIADDFRAAAEKQLKIRLSYSETSRFWAKAAWADIRHDPARWVRLLFFKLLLFFNGYELTSSLNYQVIRERIPILSLPWISFNVLSALALLGLWIDRKPWRERFPLFGFAGVYLVSNVFVLVSSEYRIAVLPVWLAWSALALVEIIRKIRKHPWGSMMYSGAGILVLIIFSIPLLSEDVLAHRKAAGYCNLGNMYVKLQDYSMAAYEFEKMWSLFPENIIHAKIYIKDLIEGGQLQTALHVLEDVQKLNSEEDVELLDTYAKVLAQVEGFQRTLDLRKRIIELEPDNPQMHFNLGVTYLWLGQDDAAESAFKNAVELDPNILDLIQKIKPHILIERSQQPLKSGNTPDSKAEDEKDQ